MSEAKSRRVRRYDISGDEHERFGRQWLGTFLVTDDGLVACNTDYGNYSYWWTSTGCADIREFLLKINTGYLLGKFAPKQEYDGATTEKEIKAYICSERRVRGLTKEEAAEEWERVRGSVDTEVDFADWLHVTKLGDAWEFAQYRTNPQATAFAERVWPRFCDALRKEMSAEKNTAA